MGYGGDPNGGTCIWEGGGVVDRHDLEGTLSRVTDWVQAELAYIEDVAAGLPDRMRSDVEALTGALRAQTSFAWFNYAPGVADRDTIELLLSTSAGDASSLTRLPRFDVRDNNGVPSNDDADLRLILTVLRAFQHHKTATGVPSAVKPLRETLFFR